MPNEYLKRNNQIISTNTYILNFNTPKPPSEIKIGYMIKVEIYIQNPLRCHNCQKFEHHKEKCTRPPTCKNCWKTGNHIDCQQPLKCANYKQNHSVNSKECKLWKKDKRILEVKHTKNICYPEARKFIENSLATTAYANIAKPTNNSTQNQGMMIHFDMINLIRELKTLLELLRESLINLTTKPHAEPDPKNLHPHSNETEDPSKTNQTKTQPQQQAPGIPPITTKPNNIPPKKLDNTESTPLNPQKRSPWKKESNKHKPQISLIETENKFELMETEPSKPFKTETHKYSKSLKIRSKSWETIEITESSQMKNKTLKPKLHLNKINIKYTTKIKKGWPIK